MKTQSELFDEQVERFEARRTKDRFASLRTALLRDVSGAVLEIAPGPGLNFIYYDHIDSLTVVDISPKMLESAEVYWQKIGKAPGNFRLGDVSIIDFPEHTFDTIVSTCSLCTYKDPVAVLNNLTRWCKPDGKIYFLEHGLSRHRPWQIIQKAFDTMHYRQKGCHCNRDIEALVRSVNLEVLALERPVQYGVIDFIYLIVARPKQTN